MANSFEITQTLKSDDCVILRADPTHEARLTVTPTGTLEINPGTKLVLQSIYLNGSSTPSPLNYYEIYHIPTFDTVGTISNPATSKAATYVTRLGNVCSMNIEPFVLNNWVNPILGIIQYPNGTIPSRFAPSETVSTYIYDDNYPRCDIGANGGVIIMGNNMGGTNPMTINTITPVVWFI